LSSSGPSPEPVRARRVVSLWFPLAASWLLMALELPLVAAVVARLPDPEVNLAAYGSVVFPLSILIEAPIIMLLAASTALAADRRAWGLMARFAFGTGFTLSALHALVAFTPLFDLVVGGLIGPPPEVIEPGRLGLRIMTPWTLAIAWRRFQQGVLIRFERSRLVGLGTLVRLASTALALLTGARLGLPGIAVGALGVSTGVCCEALFAQVVTHPLVRHLPPEAPPGAPHGPLGWARLLRFYVPLALTPLITLVVPVLSARAMSRMPERLSSLAAWTAVHGFVFLLRSIGLAFNEVVVRLVAEPGGVPVLRRIAWAAAAGTSAVLALTALTPLGAWWFGRVSGLSATLTDLASASLLLAVLMPGYQVLQSWYQGTLVSAHRTRPIPVSVAIYLLVAGGLLTWGIHHVEAPGIFWVIPALTTAGLAQTAWLRIAVGRAPPGEAARSLQVEGGAAGHDPE